jgi:hypothetical protein
MIDVLYVYLKIVQLGLEEAHYMLVLLLGFLKAIQHEGAHFLHTR